MNGLIKESLRYSIMPGIVPRLKGFDLKFGYIAYLMAVILSRVRLLPVHHPYTFYGNINSFGITQVLGAAAHNLKGGTRNIDQYLIFGGIMAGIVLLLLQFAMIFAFIAIHTAEAATTPLAGFGGMFDLDPNRTQTDVALMMLDLVFQIPGLFNSSVAPTSYALANPFAQGLHFLFGFYSRGMLMIAGLIIIYYFFVVVVESAQTGVPFGERFDSIYVPIRLVLAIVLLLPIHYGLNSGQYLTLQVAKWGSNFATNAWMSLNAVTGHNPMGLTTRELVVSPKIENIGSVINFYELAHACRAAYYYQYFQKGSTTSPKYIYPYFVKPATQNSPAGYDIMGFQPFSAVSAWFDGAPIKIVYGEQHASYESQFLAGVKPYCGEITLDIDSLNIEGIRDVYDTYYNNIMWQLWTDTDLTNYGDKTALIYFNDRGAPNGACGITTPTAWGATCAMSGTPGRCECEHAGTYFLNVQRDYFQAVFEVDMDTVINNIRSTTLNHLRITQPMLDLGWGGAGVWFNRLAEYNGALVTAALKIPKPTAMPLVMEFVSKQKRKNQPDTDIKDMYKPNIRGGENSETIDKFWNGSNLDVPAIDQGIAKFLDDTYRRLNAGDRTQDPTEKLTKNVVMDTINSLFGLSGLYELRENTDVNPMSRLAAMGRGIIDKSIMFLGGALIMSGVGGIMGAMDSSIGTGFDLTAETMAMIGMTGLTVGFIFFYLIPMMPFMYFFFAVSRWVKTIFEAMVGVPLWALAHLKIDGEGIPGQAAANGYFLLLEIMIRPILTVFGLLIAFSSFGAMVAILDTIFNVAVINVAGYNPFDAAGNPTTDYLELARSALDEFFYTVIYCIIVYMTATSCFKLIDLIPNGVLRFAGSGVASFGDKAGDPMENLTRYTAMAGASFTDEVAGAVKSVGRGAGQVVGSLMKQGAGNKTSDAVKQMKDEAMGQKLQGN